MKPILLSCLLALCVTASEAAVVITFGEQPTQPADGLLVDGVLFGFTIGGSSSTDAVFNNELPVATVNLDDRVLSGPVVGLLTLQFSAPVIAFQFGLVLNTLDPEQPAATISLFDTALQPAGDLPWTPIRFSRSQKVCSVTPARRSLKPKSPFPEPLRRTCSP